jgi:hypothetical protein
MKTSRSAQMVQQAPPLATEQARRRAVKLVLRLTENTALAPQYYERMLLDQFIIGELTIDEVIARLEVREHK